MKIAVLKNNGEETGRKVSLSEDIFGIEPNDHAIYLDVKQFLANQRQGTHKSKEEVKLLVLRKRSRNKKAPVQLVRVVSSRLFSEVEVVYSALSQETTVLS